MNVPFWYENLTIRRKFIAIAFIATVAAMLFAIAISTVMQWLTLREDLVKSVAAQTSIIALNSTDDLVSGNREAADRVVRSLARIDNIIFAGILDKNGNDFALYIRPGDTMAPHHHEAVQSEGHIHNINYIEIAYPVIYHQEQIGLIHVRSDMSPVYTKLGLNMLITVAAAAGSFVVAVLMLFRMLPTITNPIQHLVKLTEDVSKTNNFSLRAQLRSNDEVGLLANGFNTMLTQLEIHNNALAQHRRDLEEEVNLRTEELRESNTKLGRELVEREITQRELTDANEQLSILLNSLPIAVYRCRVDDFAVLYMTDNVLGFTGYSADAFMAQNDLWISRIHPDDAPVIEAAMPTFFQEGSHSYEYRWMNADGNYIWIQDSIRLIQPEEGSEAYMVGMWEDITVRKNAQIKLHESEIAYRTLAENLPGIVYRVFTREHNRMEFYNGLLLTLTGYTPEELSDGKTCSIEPLILELDRGMVIDEVTNAVKERRAFSLEYRLRHKNGTVRWMSEHGMPVFDETGRLLYIDGLMFDITERKQAEQALEESEHKFRSILDVAVDGVLLMDEKARKFIQGNRAICEMLGYTADELYELGIEDIHPKEALSRVYKEYQKQLKGEILVAQNLPVRRKDGSVFVADVSSAPMLLSGRTIMVGFFHDVTERKKAEEAIQLMATTDALTGIANRRAFSTLLDKEIARSKRYGKPLSLVMYDIDFFKLVNDNFGHDVGDSVLQAITEVVKENIREVDTVARWGGEEFMILMPETELASACVVAEKLRSEIAAHTFEQIGTLTVSLGVTTFMTDEEVNTLLKRVDDALYLAKENGRDRVERL